MCIRDSSGIYSLTYPGTYNLAYLGIYSLTYPEIYSLTYPGIYSLTYPGIYSLTYPGIDSLTYSGAYWGAQRCHCIQRGGQRGRRRRAPWGGRCPDVITDLL